MGREQQTQNQTCNHNPSKAFDYNYFDCVIRQYAQQDMYGKYVMVMTKVKNTPSNSRVSYKTEYKRTAYFLHTQNPLMPLIYFTPSSNKYNYFYLLSKVADSSSYTGEHFTFGYRQMESGNPQVGDYQELDIHYTSYVTGANKPCHLFYNFNEKMPTHTMSERVCSSMFKDNRCDSNDGTDLHTRCWFFQNLINLINPVSDVLQQQSYMPTTGMFGGQNSDIIVDGKGTNFENLAFDKQLSDIFQYVPNVDKIEVHLINNKVGIVHVFKGVELVFTFGYILGQDNSINVTSIDVVVASLKMSPVNVDISNSIPLSKVNLKLLNLLNLADHTKIVQYLETVNKVSNLQPMQYNRAAIATAGGKTISTEKFQSIQKKGSKEDMHMKKGGTARSIKKKK
jgi:hypothetical protein